MGKPQRVRLVATDEQGIVRVVEAPALTQLDAMEAVARWGDGDKELAAECSALHAAVEGPSVLALGRASGETHLVDPETGRTLAEIPPPPAATASAAVATEEEEDAGDAKDGDGEGSKKSKKAKKSDPVRGLAFLYDAAGTGCTRLPLLVVASASGKVRVFSSPAGFFPLSSSSSASASWSLVSKLDAAPKGGLRALSLAHGPRAATASGPSSSVVRVAVVSDTSELTVWDLASREKVFEAKGEKPDRLRLVDKLGGTAVCFLPDSDDQLVAAASSKSNSPSGGVGVVRCSGTLVAVGTGTGRVRLYDTRHGKRPVASVVLSGDGGGGKAGCSTSSAARATPLRNNGLSGAGAAVTALAPEAGGAAFSRVWAGDSAGLLRSVDLRTARPEGVLKGATGGVRAAVPHPRAALVASAGADGFLRVHHARTRKLVGSLWLKQPLRSVSWCPFVAATGAGGGAGEGEKKGKKSKDEKKKKSKKRRRSDDDEEDEEGEEEDDASSSSSSDSDDEDDEQSFLEASNLTLLPPEEKGKRKKKKKKAVPPPLPGGKKEKKARKKGGSAKKNKLRKEAAKAAKQAKYEAARGGGRGGGGE